MTVEELLCNRQFIALCGCWQRDGKCPIVFIDWLYDNGLDDAAEIARWCIDQGDDLGHLGSDGIGGIRPFGESVHSGVYSWGASGLGYKHRSSIPVLLFKRIVAPLGYKVYKTYAEAIACLFIDGKYIEKELQYNG